MLCNRVIRCTCYLPWKFKHWMVYFFIERNRAWASWVRIVWFTGQLINTSVKRGKNGIGVTVATVSRCWLGIPIRRRWCRIDWCRRSSLARFESCRTPSTGAPFAFGSSWGGARTRVSDLLRTWPRKELQFWIVERNEFLFRFWKFSIVSSTKNSEYSNIPCVLVFEILIFASSLQVFKLHSDTPFPSNIKILNVSRVNIFETFLKFTYTRRNQVSNIQMGKILDLKYTNDKGWKSYKSFKTLL